jgi:hypothetical protein
VLSQPELKPTLWNRVWQWLCPGPDADLACRGFGDLDTSIPANVRSFVEESYPHNHTYTAAGGSLIPSRKLAERVVNLTQHYPKPLESFVDLSCSKGFFVFHAAMQADCQRALGVDLNEQCLDVCRLLNSRFERQSQTCFEKLSLTELALRINEFGGPFRTALLVNTYQYLVFGSSVAPSTSLDHREIFRLLRRVCSGRLIFHNRLSLADLQSDPQDRARRAGSDVIYEPAAILAAASEFFHVRSLDPWSLRPVWLLDAC